MRNYRNYSDEDIIKHSKDVKSMSALLKRLNLSVTGGNFLTMYDNIKRLNIDISHWLGQGWSKNKQFKSISEYTRNSARRKHLITLRGNKCENCGITVWMNKPIILEIHHIDGDKTNNNEDNLQLLCPNCHSMTDNWRKPKIYKK